ncbi:cytochrome P450 [Paenibacillus sp. R14(2021)]|uniref:cytochrome P450 n=1 Tax=Paenibacillus sp. R14(2021) TaxID=2859228 RepID=UPI001C61251A|nr:cytochrome P450 [Paenibacillus sp. R14(2021)]
MKKSERYANIIPMAELNTKEKRLQPFSVFNQLRQTTPIRYDNSRSCWDIFRYEDIHRILKDPATFSSRRGLAIKDRETILTMNPPRHTQLRGLVNKAFTPKVISDLATRISAITDELLNVVEGTMDIVSSLAVPLPVIIIAELLGVPPEDRNLFKEWSDILVKGPDQNTDEEFNQVIAEKVRANDELNDYFARIVEQRRIEPKEDLISLLLQAEVEGERLSDKEILGFSILLLAAGNETTTNLITNAVRRVTEDRTLQQQLRGNPELIPGFIEEVLRFYPPIQAVGRIAAQDVEIGDIMIKKGQQVVSWVASANRDEAKFAKPDTFIVDRKPNAHLSFGFGIHFCLGAPLARLEGKIVIERLMKRYRDIQFVTDSEMTYIQSPFVYGVKQFTVSIT